MPSFQLSLLKWIGIDRVRREMVSVYVVRYRIPCEDGRFFIERTLDDGRKIKVQIVPREIRNKIKNLRFKFYQILRKYHVYKTDFGRIVDPENAPYLGAELREWLNEYISVQKLIDRYLKRPWEFSDWPIIRKYIEKYEIKWPPNNLDLAKDVYATVDGPIKIPRKLYDQLILKAITNIEEDENQ